MHASFSIACAIEWCHFSPVISFVFTILIFAMAFNQRNKINFNIISRWKMRSAILLLLLCGASSPFRSAEEKNHFSSDWWEWLATLQLLCVGLLFVIRSGVRVKCEWNVYTSLSLSVCSVCRCLSHEYSWDEHISHFLHHFLTCLIDIHARRIYICYSISNQKSTAV